MPPFDTDAVLSDDLSLPASAALHAATSFNIKSSPPYGLCGVDQMDHPRIDRLGASSKSSNQLFQSSESSVFKIGTHTVPTKSEKSPWPESLPSSSLLMQPIPRRTMEGDSECANSTNSQKTHREVEKRYRTSISASMAELKDAVPSWVFPENQRICTRMTKAEIMRHALHYMKLLEEQQWEMQEQMAMMEQLLSQCPRP